MTLGWSTDILGTHAAFQKQGLSQEST